MKRLWLAACFAASAAQAQVTVEKPWVRATAPGAKVGGGYVLIRNAGTAADRLVGASSPAAARVELHTHIREGEVMKMREVRAFDVPARGSFELKPGGAHLMFMELKRPFKEGERVPVTLKFESAGELGAEFHVGRLGGAMAPGAHRR
ncbi:MAG: copper chaperone PCu(A)C [Betaproteobacteria bacterium]|nr:MAG: copper chaperone PCu(A)C [Betaproteobacteria bacterium]